MNSNVLNSADPQVSSQLNNTFHIGLYHSEVLPSHTSGWGFTNTRIGGGHSEQLGLSELTSQVPENIRS